MKALDISRLLQPVFATAENGFAARPVLLRGRGSDEVRGFQTSGLAPCGAGRGNLLKCMRRWAQSPFRRSVPCASLSVGTMSLGAIVLTSASAVLWPR